MDRKKIILVLIFIVVFLLRLPSLFEPFTYGDEGVYVTLGQAAKKGAIFYRDIHDNKPPLLYVLAAVSGDFANFRLILFVWSFVTIFAFYKLASLLLPKHVALLITGAFGILSSIHTFEGNVANAENFMMLPTIVAFYLILENKGLLFWAGALLSLATLFKAPAGFDFIAALGLIVVLEGKMDLRVLVKKIVTISIGFVIPIALTLIYYSFFGALPAYLKAAFLQNIGYLSSWSGDKPKAFSLPIPLLTRAGMVFATWCVLFFLRKQLSSPTKVVIIWFAFALFGALLSGRPYPHYLLQPIVPLTLSFGLLFIKSKVRIVPLLLLACFVFTFAFFKFWHYQNVSYYQNFYAFSLKLKSRPEYFRYFGDETENLYQTAIYLATHTDKNEKVFIWGNQPSIYALAKRTPVGRYTVAYHIIDFNAYNETITALGKETPEFIVVTGEENRPFPDLEALIKSDYRQAEQFGKIKVYLRLTAGKF